MKRHSDLLQLSREHHDALKLARDARRAAEHGTPGVLAAFATHATQTFATKLDPHFSVEERGLLVLLAQAGQLELVVRTHTEHSDLRRLVRDMATPDVGTLLRFADLLMAHVRFEEREVFEAVQTILSKQSIPI